MVLFATAVLQVWDTKFKIAAILSVEQIESIPHFPYTEVSFCPPSAGLSIFIPCALAPIAACGWLAAWVSEHRDVRSPALQSLAHDIRSWHYQRRSGRVLRVYLSVHRIHHRQLVSEYSVVRKS